MTESSDRPLHVIAADERDRRGWSQKDAAAAAGMSLRAYQEFESGRSKPQSKNRRGIVRAFELDGTQSPLEQDSPTGWDICPTCGTPAWPQDVRAYHNMIGAYLLTMTEQEREAWILRETRRIFEAVHKPVD